MTRDELLCKLQSAPQRTCRLVKPCCCLCERDIWCWERYRDAGKLVCHEKCLLKASDGKIE